eukprot:Lankesteria_metandrocarpae@DN2877_c0_g1_i1.p1
MNANRSVHSKSRTARTARNFNATEYTKGKEDVSDEEDENNVCTGDESHGASADDEDYEGADDLYRDDDMRCESLSVDLSHGAGGTRGYRSGKLRQQAVKAHDGASQRDMTAKLAQFKKELHSLETSVRKDFAPQRVPPREPERVHFDYLVVEGRWMLECFTAERKRKMRIYKSTASAAIKFISTKEARRMKLLEEETKRRRAVCKTVVAASVRQLWKAIDTIVLRRAQESLRGKWKDKKSQKQNELLGKASKYTLQLSCVLGRALQDSSVLDGAHDIESVDASSTAVPDGESASDAAVSKDEKRDDSDNSAASSESGTEDLRQSWARQEEDDLHADMELDESDGKDSDTGVEDKQTFSANTSIQDLLKSYGLDMQYFARQNPKLLGLQAESRTGDDTNTAAPTNGTDSRDQQSTSTTAAADTDINADVKDMRCGFDPSSTRRRMRLRRAELSRNRRGGENLERTGEETPADRKRLKPEYCISTGSPVYQRYTEDSAKSDGADTFLEEQNSRGAKRQRTDDYASHPYLKREYSKETDCSNTTGTSVQTQQSNDDFLLDSGDHNDTAAASCGAQLESTHQVSGAVARRRALRKVRRVQPNHAGCDHSPVALDENVGDEVCSPHDTTGNRHEASFDVEFTKGVEVSHANSNNTALKSYLDHTVKEELPVTNFCVPVLDTCLQNSHVPRPVHSEKLAVRNDTSLNDKLSPHSSENIEFNNYNSICTTGTATSLHPT